LICKLEGLKSDTGTIASNKQNEKGWGEILLKTIDNAKVWAMLKSIKSIELNLFIDEHGQWPGQVYP
jgi:hypothetical protein